MMNLNILQKQFANKPGINFEANQNGLIIIHVKNSYAQAAISLQGAHIIEFTPTSQQPLLWLSKDAILAPGKSIRGGIPVCWPWFGAHPSNQNLPAHGYARTTDWRLIHIDNLACGRTQLEFELSPAPPHNLALSVRYKVIIGQDLELELTTTNTGESDIILTNALHTYFNVSDISNVSIHGLEHCPYIDTLDNNTTKHHSLPILISEETDRIYLDTPRKYEIIDSGLQRRIEIHTQNSLSAIVWNPWIEKSRRLGDMAENSYRTMLCVETANAADNRIQLGAKAVHRLGARYQLKQR